MRFILKAPNFAMSRSMSRSMSMSRCQVGELGGIRGEKLETLVRSITIGGVVARILYV